MFPLPLPEEELISLIPLTDAKRASSFEVASCSITLGSAPAQENLTDSDDDLPPGFSSRFSRYTSGIPHRISNIKTTITVKEDILGFVSNKIKLVINSQLR